MVTQSNQPPHQDEPARVAVSAGNGFELLLYHAPNESEFAQAMARAVQALGLGIRVHLASDVSAASAVIDRVEAAYGHVPPDLFAQASRLRWLACPQAGPDPRFFHQALIDSAVTVTNVRGIYNDHISAHIMAFVLAFSRGLPTYWSRQQQRTWQSGARTIYLPEASAAIVGFGGIGAETARRCADFGMRVVAVDPRVESKPDFVDRLYRPDQLLAAVADVDFVIVAAPETPATRGLCDSEFFVAMHKDAYFINIGRGAIVKLDALNQALRAGQIAGAALDVFEVEPLPTDYPLWDAPGMLITPHVATVGPGLQKRRISVLSDNCRRFALGQPLNNVVDKLNWF